MMYSSCTKEFIEDVLESYEISIKSINEIEDYDEIINSFSVNEAATDTEKPADTAAPKENDTTNKGVPSDNPDNVNKTSKVSELYTTVKGKIKTNIAKLFEEIKLGLNKLGIKIKKYMNMYAANSKRWRKDLAEMQAKAKPVQALEFVTYSYNINLLNQIYNRMTSFYGTASRQILEDLRQIHDQGTADNLKQDHSMQDFMAGARRTILPEAKKEMNTTAGFINQIIEVVRGQKKKIVYKAEHMNAVLKLTDTVEAIKRRATALMNENSNVYRACDSLQRSYRNDPKADATIGRKALELGKSIAKLRSMYSATVKVYLQLHYEIQTNYRLIARRMYGF